MAPPRDDDKKNNRNRFQEDDEDGEHIAAAGWGPKGLYLRLKNGIQQNRKRYILAASAMLAAGFFCFFAWATLAVIEMRRPTVEMAVEALDLGAYEHARYYATSVIKYANKNEKEKRGTALYAYGVAICEEVERVWLEDKKPFYRNAADALIEARELGFMPDRATDGYFYLGKALYHSQNYPAAIKYLEIARERQSSRKKPIAWYLANAYSCSPEPDYVKGLEALERFQASPMLLEREKQAASLLKTFLNLRLDRLDDAKTSFHEIPPLTDPRMILQRELAAGKIRMQEAGLFHSHADMLEKTPQLIVPKSELDRLDRPVQDTPLLEQEPPLPQREPSASPFLLHQEQVRDEPTAANNANNIVTPAPKPAESQALPASKDEVVATWRRLANQQSKEALRHFEVIKRNDVELLDLYRQAMFLEAFCFEQLGDFERAQEVYYALTRIFPATPEAAASTFRWGYIEHILKNNPKAGLAAMTRFFEMFDHLENYSSSWMTLSDISNVGLAEIEKLIDSRQFAQAEELLNYFRRIVSEDHQARLFSHIYSQWGEQLANQAETKRNDEKLDMIRQTREKFRMAGKWYEELAKWTFRAPDYLTNVWEAAGNYERGRDFPKALAMYRMYLEHEAVLRQAQARYRIGNILFELNEIDAAIRELEYCLANYPDDLVTEPARLVLAYAYQEKQQWDKAVQLLKRNLDGIRSPDSDVFRDSLYELGRVYDCIGDNAGTLAVFDEVLTLYPGDPKTAEAHYLIAKTCLDDEAKLNAEIPRVQLPRQAILVRNTLADTQRRALDHLQQARTLLVRQEEQRGLDMAEDRMLRNTFFMIGRLLTEMGPDRYEDALQENKTAVARYQAHPDVLQAYLQLARVTQLLGWTDQANQITTQAKNLLAQFIAADAFRQETIYTQQQWQNLLGTR